MEAGEEQQVCDLVVRVFSDFVAPLYSPEGVHEFLTYAADPGQLRSRLLANRFVLVADFQGRIMGAIEVRNCDHIREWGPGVLKADIETASLPCLHHKHRWTSRGFRG